MWESDYKESWVPKNWCFWTVVLEKTLESLESKEIQPVHPKGDQSWIFTGRTDAEAETPVLWPPDAKSWLTGKDPDSGKDWRQKEKGTTEDESLKTQCFKIPRATTKIQHHWLDAPEFEQALGVGDGQGSLVRCSSWGRKELDATERLNWTDLPQVGTRGSEGISLLWPPLPGKIIKRFFFYFTQNCLRNSIWHWCTASWAFSNKTDHLGSITDKTVWDRRVSLYHLSLFSPHHMA